ncbi:hypothetical protein DVG78_26085 [Runella aurantiaca]|uniref:Alpha-L-rhamnosidase six-hairpin glycosidase domain-containing protein n=2 Tax=Runella aurantiaca TaxID=2282308 RepID=A0A369I244_9BACT|nr:hypothetical protein DVG78_26085 [Runella aurantiaca]
MSKSFSMKTFPFFLLFILAAVVGFAQAPFTSQEKVNFEQALTNGQAANEAFRRSHRFLLGWLSKADPTTGLIPRNLKESTCIWNAYDAAADNYPFMVMTAAMLDKPLFEGKMREMLATETRLTSRVGRLPDTYSFCKKGFQNDHIDTSQVVFGSAEYMKDGLVPLTEWLGPSPWSERMLGILEDLDKIVDVPTQIKGNFFGNSAVVEVGGDLLQVLARMYWLTKNPKWLAWGIQIGDYYLSDAHLPTRTLSRLRLRDHGCEIVAGLAEMYAVVATENLAKKQQWQPYLHEMLITILATGRNEHGLFYDEVNPLTGEVVQKRIADNFGYTLNAFYTVYMIDGVAAYREATLKALGSLSANYRNHDWENGSADGYADAIEGALNLYLREPIPSVKDWLESEIKVLWNFQKPDGIIEGWHGDGNFARTSLMYALWKTAGVHISDWNPEVIYGAVNNKNNIYITLTSPTAWKGKLIFGANWHADHLHMPTDYPRINQFQEWFSIEATKNYRLTIGNKTQTIKGSTLIAGFPISLKPNETIHLRCAR